MDVCGGLGNQLFQIFTMLSYCMDNNKKIVLRHYDGKRHPYWDTVFKICQKYVTDHYIQVKYTYDDPCYCQYNPIPIVTHSIRLSGYFQMLNYFDYNKI